MNGLELLNAEPFMVEGCDGPYKDYLNVPVALIKRQMKSPKSKRKGPRGGVSEPFPTKLYEMLVGVAKEGLQHIVSWQPHGRCFVIHHSAAFINEIMPRYFKQSKLTSFQRQLNLYGFQRISSGLDRGGYFHPLFLQGRPDICRVMLRTRVKGGAADILPPNTRTSSVLPSLYVLPYCSERTREAIVSGSEDESVDESQSSSTSVGSPVFPKLSEVSLDSATRPSSRFQPMRALASIEQTIAPLEYVPTLETSNNYSASPTIVENVPDPLMTLQENYGFFEGQKFCMMDPDFLRAYEKQLMPV